MVFTEHFTGLLWKLIKLWKYSSAKSILYIMENYKYAARNYNKKITHPDTINLLWINTQEAMFWKKNRRKQIISPLFEKDMLAYRIKYNAWPNLCEDCGNEDCSGDTRYQKKVFYVKNYPLFILLINKILLYTCHNFICSVGWKLREIFCPL